MQKTGSVSTKLVESSCIVLLRTSERESLLSSLLAASNYGSPSMYVEVNVGLGNECHVLSIDQQTSCRCLWLGVLFALILAFGQF